VLAVCEGEKAVRDFRGGAGQARSLKPGDWMGGHWPMAFDRVPASIFRQHGAASNTASQRSNSSMQATRIYNFVASKQTVTWPATQIEGTLLQIQHRVGRWWQDHSSAAPPIRPQDHEGPTPPFQPSAIPEARAASPTRPDTSPSQPPRPEASHKCPRHTTPCPPS
jgi:hypothetical protein